MGEAQSLHQGKLTCCCRPASNLLQSVRNAVAGIAQSSLHANLNKLSAAGTEDHREERLECNGKRGRP